MPSGTVIANWGAAIFLWLGLILTPIVAHAGGLGFQIIAFTLGCSGLLLTIIDRDWSSYFRKAWLPIFIGFLSWAWITSLWSPYEKAEHLGHGLMLFVFGVILIFLPTIFDRLREGPKRLIAHLFMAGSVLAIGLMLIDILSGFGLSILVDPVDAGSNIYVRQGDAEQNLGRGIMSYSQLIWPAIILILVHFKRGWVLIIGLILALAVTAILNRLSLCIPVLCVSAAFVALAASRPRLGIISAFLVAISTLLFAPIIGVLASLVDEATLSSIPLSWEHRVRMWAFVWERIQESWLIGNGFDVSRTLQDTFLSRDGRDITIVSLHPHNIGLQLWLETGLIGVLLATGFLMALIKPVLVFCETKPRAAAMSGLIVATALNGALTIGIWQYWWWGLIALSAGLVSLIPHNHKAFSPMS